MVACGATVPMHCHALPPVIYCDLFFWFYWILFAIFCFYLILFDYICIICFSMYLHVSLFCKTALRWNRMEYDGIWQSVLKFISDMPGRLFRLAQSNSVSECCWMLLFAALRYVPGARMGCSYSSIFFGFYKTIKKIKNDLKRYKKFLSLLTHVQLFYLFLCYTNIHIYTHKYTNFV